MSLGDIGGEYGQESNAETRRVGRLWEKSERGADKK
jgi:hypothetical protein